MKWKIISVVLLALALKVSAAPGVTNFVFSQTTVSNMLYTNRVHFTNVFIPQVSNAYYVASNNVVALSNLNWFVTNNMTLTTNFVNVSPNQTNTLYFTNGTLHKVTVP